MDRVPLPMDKHVPGTVFARLIGHDPDFARYGLEAEGKILQLDIDCVITGSLDRLITDHENIDYAIWKNPNWPRPQRAYFQSSVQLYEPGARPQLFTQFNKETTPRWVNWRFGGREQAWISETLSWKDTHVITEHDGVYGAGRLGGEGVYGGDLPGNACIVGFPGARAPWQDEIKQQFPWVKDHYYAEDAKEQEDTNAGRKVPRR